MFYNTQLVMERLDEPFVIRPDVAIESGNHWWNKQRIGLNTSTKRPVELELAFDFGEFYDGHQLRYFGFLRFKPIRYFAIETGYELNQIRLPAGDFDTRIASVRARASLNPELTWFNLVQYDDLSDAIGVQSRVQWEFRPGAYAYVVFNQALDRNHGRPRVTQNEATVKISVALRF